LLEPGQIFASRYRVNRQIAEGGMGAIFEAVHTATERKVALKLLFPHIMSIASARQKFELEAKISARVNSPYIVEVLDAGFDEPTKSPFLVMELLNGQTVASYVEQRGALSADEALPMLEQMADALDAAHGYKESGAAKPIVHRDLKPENLFMAREHGTVMVKILDFGIAKVLGETSNLSQEVRGTPLYMAVEQITAGVLSPQTDVWALGLIAYYMLTGKSYWRSANNEAANMQSLFAEILTLPIDAPSLRVREVAPSVALPPGFDAWLLKCIDRAPTRRFASAGAAIEELARAFRRTPRARARPSMRTGAHAFAQTELGAAPPPQPAPAPPKLATMGSLPGMASEHRSLAGAVPVVSRKPLVAAAAAGGALFLGGLVWAFSGGADAPVAAPAPAAVMPAPAAAAAEPAVAPVVAPAPVVAVSPPPAPEPAPAAALPAPSAAPPPKAEVAATPTKVPVQPRPAAVSRPVRRTETSVPATRKPAAQSSAPPPKKSASDAYRMR